MQTFIPRQQSDHSCHDSCPSTLRLFPAQDGGIARIRKPGSFFSPEEWAFLGHAATSYGDGYLHVSNRSHPQLRGVATTTAHQRFIADVAAAGLLPHPTHDSVRTVLVSPIPHPAGPSTAEMNDLVTQLDHALCARPQVAQLSGRTIIALDNGSGDVCYERPDLGAIAQPDGRWLLILAAAPSTIVCDQKDLVAVLAAATQAYAEFPRQQWRMVDEEGCVDAITRSLLATFNGVPDHVSGDTGNTAQTVARTVTEGPLTLLPSGTVAFPPRRPHTVGIVDDAICAVVPFGQIPATAVMAMAGLGYPVRLTPWHSVVLYEVPVDARESVVDLLQCNGMSCDSDAPANWVSACGGLPGCRKSLADVRADATIIMNSPEFRPGIRIHYSGCARRCGHPNGAHWDRLATADGSYVETFMGPDGRTPVSSGGPSPNDF